MVSPPPEHRVLRDLLGVREDLRRARIAAMCRVDVLLHRGHVHRGGAMSKDGSTIVFLTAAPLSNRAINGQPDVYEWHNGHVGMISTGTSPVEDLLRPAIRELVAERSFAPSHRSHMIRTGSQQKFRAL